MANEASGNNNANCTAALAVMKTKLNGRLLSYMNSCVSCGLCAESCHYYLSDNNSRNVPGLKVGQISAIYKRYNTFSGRLFPEFFGAKELDDNAVDELTDLTFGSCTMCGRCTMHCSIGIDIPLLVRTARSMLVEMHKVPKGLKSTADAALKSGNNMNIPREELVDTLKWLEEELQMEVNDPNATIPLDKPNAKVLYTLNPREPKFFPLSISAVAKIFYYAKEDWTISTNVYDVTNYPYFAGDDRGAAELVERHAEEIAKLNAASLALAECGHGYRVLRWEGPQWLAKSYPFKAVSIIELIAEYIKSGKIILDPAKNNKLTTLHDPCNLVRNGGVIEEQRYILNQAVNEFIEMYPNRENNYCCGGGGGQLAMGEYSERRVKAGSIKAEQIRKTRAKVVATPCHNCIDQLTELNKVFDLKVEIKTISEIVADALIHNTQFV